MMQNDALLLANRYDVQAMKEQDISIDESLDALDDAISSVSSVRPYAICGHVEVSDLD